MIEKPAFEIFVPANTKNLILGSFSALGSPTGTGVIDPAYNWYYGTKRNQFWLILEAVYKVELRTTDAKKTTIYTIRYCDYQYHCRVRPRTRQQFGCQFENIKYNDSI